MLMRFQWEKQVLPGEIDIVPDRSVLCKQSHSTQDVSLEKLFGMLHRLRYEDRRNRHKDKDMFRNDRQASRVIQMLLRTLDLEHLWTDQGPTRTALQYKNSNGGPLSSGERLMLLAVFDLWDGSGRLPFNELVAGMDAERTAKLLSVVAALGCGSSAVDQWLLHETSQLESPRPAP